ncbi:MAG: DNA-binding protein [Candidatus Cloacimonetes bacterium]|nr:DNA-binding protein [Candidatus Cloacimonadota bacterium]
MAKDLTNSNIDRQNILNNQYALDEVAKAIDISGIIFEGKMVFFKQQVADFFEVTSRTIDNYLNNNETELAQNGYEILKGKRLKLLKLMLKEKHVSEIDFIDMKTPQVGVFDFRSFLNLAMLMIESDRARLLRQAILDIVIDTINVRTGGGTKYINQRDEDFIQSWFSEDNYRKQFTSALNTCVAMGNVKFAIYTDKIYLSIFKEKASEYKAILNLREHDIARDTFYAEILDLVSSYECGFADALMKESQKLGRKLSIWETDSLFMEFASQAHWKPLIDKARVKMASRDLAFRDALHLQLQEYITPLQAEEFERFLGEKSKELAERLEEAKDVMKRLKDRE